MTAAPSLLHVPWHRSVFYAFDTETTGIDVWNDRIVTATIASPKCPRLSTERKLRRCLVLLSAIMVVPPCGATTATRWDEYARRCGRRNPD